MHDSGHHLKTEGEHFTTLNTDERRDYLAQRKIVSAHRDSDGEINLTIFPKDWPERDS